MEPFGYKGIGWFPGIFARRHMSVGNGHLLFGGMAVLKYTF